MNWVSSSSASCSPPTTATSSSTSARAATRSAGSCRAREPRPEDFPEGYDQARKAWEQEDENLWNAWTAGAVEIAEHGCSFSTWLAISGPHRGTVWHDLRGVSERIVPVAAPGRPPLTFGEWYRTPHDVWSEWVYGVDA